MPNPEPAVEQAEVLKTVVEAAEQEIAIAQAETERVKRLALRALDLAGVVRIRGAGEG